MVSHKFCMKNCGGTGCNAVTYTATKKCKHKNGVFIDVNIWLFSKTVFHCLDCSEQMSRKELEQQEED